MIRSGLCDRMSVSWRARFSVRTRYEIASAVAIFGLILALCGSGAVYLAFTSCAISEMFIQGCVSLGLMPIPVAILSLLLGMLILLYGIYLLPQQKEE
ncbi:putative membrane protein [Chlamydia psittaci M56]|nr:putative membrane protein [Chlamydia psittaci M56]